MLHRADAALYAAKDAGRNCVRTHAGMEEQITPRVA
jgi:PleD family two-component response regulator